ncbi:MAG TPA: carbohydrate kinase family protein [Pyrinomonadaceae bacterium]|jgi:sugar/nucleoside kinase (ribokinase family)|nr:carbohydrate kinase family protein [Pyrinomonadaceae bacterium]
MKFPFELKKNADLDVLGFGTNAVDFLIQVPHYPEFNSKVELTRYDQMAGGEVASTMAGLQRLGLKTAYAGRFGTDSAGDYGLQTLKGEGVDTKYAEQIEDAKTQIAFIVIDERSGERTVIWQRDERLAYTETDAPLDAVPRAKVLHFTPHDVKACIVMARRAKELGVIVSVDIDNLFEGVQELLSHVDIFIASADFPKKLFGTHGSREALREIKSLFGCGIVGVTLGEEGSLLLCGGEFIETPGFAAPGGCKDTTGAGDAFRVGLLYGLIRGETVEEAARMANAVAALKCRAVGARTALPDREDLLVLLGNG